MLNQILQLVRPLAVLDLETTGLNAETDRIIQVGMTMHYPDKDPIVYVSLINPECPIKNTGSHKITDEDVVDSPKFRELAANADIAGHNVAGFDVGFFKAEMKRAGIDWKWDNHIIDTLNICRIMIPHTLENAYKRFVNVQGFGGAHDAGNDVAACQEILYAQLIEFRDMPRTVPELSEFCFKKKDGIDKTGKFIWKDGEACINFGKHRGKPLREVDRGYLTWMINTDNFPDDAILICGDALKGIYPKKP